MVGSGWLGDEDPGCRPAGITDCGDDPIMKERIGSAASMVTVFAGQRICGEFEVNLSLCRA
jgi:hypothetical protein